MKNKNIVFMGTPDFSVPVLKMLIENTNVLLVVTQPDKIVGKDKTVSFNPVKKLALEENIPVFQPMRIRKDFEKLKNLDIDLIVTCAYGQIIPKEVLDMPKYGCINVHASLLPKLRGGAPIHKAIINGYDKTGITIMYMDKGMDTGDMIEKAEVKIEDNDTAESLHDKLSAISVPLLMKTLPSIINGTNKREKQNDTDATYAYNVSREEEHVSFDKSSKDIFNQIRGLNSWPGAYAVLDGKNIKLWSCVINNKKYDKAPGTIINLDKNGLEVTTTDGSVLIKELQLPGKKKMDIKDFINGNKKADYVGKCFK